jgi:16S rRNA (cytidine1402-2'-O)-methyltransferase
MKNAAPVLYLIPSTLGDTIPQEVISPKALQILKALDHFIVEEERTARRFLIKAGIDKPVDSLTFFILNEHTGKDKLASFFDHSGNLDLGLLSEAGVPAVADPGTDLIRMAHRKGFKVVPLVGPSSVLLAVMASGLNGQQFAFNGYLPVKTNDRIARIRFLEKRSLQEKQSQVFIEAPYRNNQLMQSILENCSPETWVCIASNLTLENEWISTRPVAEWKKEIPDLNKQPTVFIMQKF